MNACMKAGADVACAMKQSCHEVYKDPVGALFITTLFFAGTFSSGALLSNESWSKCLVNAIGISVLNAACFFVSHEYVKDKNGDSNLAKFFTCTALSSTLLMVLSAYATGYPSLSSLSRVIKQIAVANLGVAALAYAISNKN